MIGTGERSGLRRSEAGEYLQLAGGSLSSSSTNSSSGCSSGSMCSPTKGLTRKCDLTGDKDYLEVNELLYLASGLSGTLGEGIARKRIDSGVNETMSEFSAIALRKSISKQGATLRRLKKDKSECYCCCCRKCCSGAERAGERCAATIVGRQAAACLTAAKSSWTRRGKIQMRRPLPIPPPVVPLDEAAAPPEKVRSLADLKQLESAPLEGTFYADNWTNLSAKQQQQQRTRSCQNSLNRTDVGDANEIITSGGAHVSPTSLGQRTGGLFRQFKQTIIGNFASSSLLGAQREKFEFHKLDTSEQSIYDTPEACERRVLVKRPAPRPSIPPPPPPSQRERDQRRSSGSLKGDCVEAINAVASALEQTSVLIKRSAKEVPSGGRVELSGSRDGKFIRRVELSSFKESRVQSSANKVKVNENEEDGDWEKQRKVVKWAAESHRKTVQQHSRNNPRRKETSSRRVALDEQLCKVATSCSGIALERSGSEGKKLEIGRTQSKGTANMGATHSSHSNRSGGFQREKEEQETNNSNNNNNNKSNLATNKSLHTRNNGSIKALSTMTNKLIIGAESKSTSQHNEHNKTLLSNHFKPNLLAKLCKSTNQSAKNCAIQVEQKALEGTNDELEMRRASIRNGDVFIYPSIYTDLNECHKCLRDRLICNCNTDYANNTNETPTSQDSRVDFKTETKNECFKENELQHNQLIKFQSNQQKVLQKDSHIKREKLIDKLCPPIKSRSSTATTTTTLRDTRTRHKESSSNNFIYSSPTRGNEPFVGQLTDGATCIATNSQSNYEADENLLLTEMSSRSDSEQARKRNVKVGSQLNNKQANLDPSSSHQVDLNNNNRLKCDKEGFENEEEQLTCNLSARDSIKISCTPIHISSIDLSTTSKSKLSANEDSHASIIQIETLSRRRRNINTKLSRQPIHEDDDFQTRTNPNQDELCVHPPSLNLRRDSLDLPKSDNQTSSDVLEYSPILTSVRDYIENFNTEFQVKRATSGLHSQQDAKTNTETNTVNNQESIVETLTGETILLSSNNIPPPQQQATSSTLEATSTVLVNGANESVTGGGDTTSNIVDGEPSKKSIFDGASKDEILEYLEDARERVPDILMAADDVMVINENELIVVNQLQPNSLETPITIVDAGEVINNEGNELSSIDIGSQQDENDPDKIRQHLRQIYKSSQLSSGNETVDEDWNQSSSIHSNSASLLQQENAFHDGSKSITNSMDNSGATSNSRKFADLKSFSCSTRATLDSLEGDQMNNTNDESSPNLENVVYTEAEQKNSNVSNIILYQSSLRNNLSRDSKGTSLKVSKKTSEMSQSKKANDNPLSILSNRRNSLSENPNHRCERNNSALQMLVMMQRYSNRDSLSSSSSSPPSSTSPSSTSSTDQTSGNCSAASNFYASPSLSCSSPLLILNSNASLPAFKNSINNVTKTNNVKLDIENLSTIDSQMLENLVKEINFEQQSTNETPVDSTSICSSNNEREDSGLGNHLQLLSSTSYLSEFNKLNSINANTQSINNEQQERQLSINSNQQTERSMNSFTSEQQQNSKLSIIEEVGNDTSSLITSTINKDNSLKLNNLRVVTPIVPTFSSSANLMSRTLHGHYATMNRLNHYFLNRHPLDNNNAEKTIEFQCLDCDQFIDVDHATILLKSNEFRLLQESEGEVINNINSNKAVNQKQQQVKDKSISTEQLDRAYIAAMNGLPLCKGCEKKRIERKEIITEFVETELKYGRDLKIIHEEFYRPMQIAGLLSKDQINGVFLNLEELIMAHCRFFERLSNAINEANLMCDTDYNTVNIGRMFVESAEMLHTFESYCIRQGSAACLLARLAKEKELLRIFLRVSQIENTLLRRMNLAAFLMVPVQRVTRYPLLLNRLYKVTAYHHKDREALRDAQLKVELHLEHINQQTKGVGATNKIWRRISNLSAPISNRRGLINAEDIGYIKLRKTAMDTLKWDRDETQFIHSGRINFAPLNEFLTKQKAKSIRYMAAHALLIVLGKPNWKYRPDLVKSNLDNKLMTPTQGGNGIKETALLLFREKNGRFVPCREPLFLSNCILSVDCSQFNNECPINQACQHSKSISSATSSNQTNVISSQNSSLNGRQKLPSTTSDSSGNNDMKSFSIDSANFSNDSNGQNKINSVKGSHEIVTDLRASSISGDALSMSSMKSLPEENNLRVSTSPPTHASRSYSLASALPRTTIQPTVNANPNGHLTKSNSAASSSTIFNQLITKVNNYHKQSSSGSKASLSENSRIGSPSSTNSSSNPPQQTTAQPATTGSNVNISNVNQTTSIITATSLSNTVDNNNKSKRSASISSQSGCNGNGPNNSSSHSDQIHQHYNHLYFYNHHNQPYGDYEESFEIHERLTKDSLLFRADTPLKTRFWLQMLRYHAKDLGQWRQRRNGLSNIMMMRQE